MNPNMETIDLASRFDNIAKEVEDRFVAPKEVEDALATVISFLNTQIGRKHGRNRCAQVTAGGAGMTTERTDYEAMALEQVRRFEQANPNPTEAALVEAMRENATLRAQVEAARHTAERWLCWSHFDDKPWGNDCGQQRCRNARLILAALQPQTEEATDG